MKLLINQNSYWNYNWASNEKYTVQSLKIVDDEWKTICKEVWDQTFKCILRLNSSEEDTTIDFDDFYQNFEVSNIIDLVSFSNDTEDKSFFLETLLFNYDLISANHKKSKEENIKKKIEQLQNELKSLDAKYITDTENIVAWAKHKFNESFGWMKSFIDRTKLNDLIEWSETYNKTLWDIMKYEIKYNNLVTLYNFLFNSDQTNQNENQ